MIDNIKRIKKSIEKWEKIRDRVGFDKGPLNCDLCKRFHYVMCYQCPIKDFTGKIRCENTPYEEWTDHWFTIHVGSDRIEDIGERNIEVLCIKCQEIAKKEVDFLKKILEIEEQKFE